MAISETLAFAPTKAMLAAALDELADLGAQSGSAVDSASRLRALDAYLAAPAERGAPPTWRHDYARLPFADLAWSSGRMRVPALPPGRARPVAPRELDDQDAPALAVENAGGLVHLGSTYLEPQERRGDARVAMLALADAQRLQRAALAAIHGTIVAPDADRFTALATAYQNCGAFVDIPADVVLDAPLQLVWASRPGEASAVFPHTVVRVGANAQATIIERFVGETESFISAIVEVDLERGARLDYVAIQQTDEGARLFVHRGARCAEGATIGWHVAHLGGALVRDTLVADLGARRANAEIDALFFARGFAHVDLQVRCHHRASETESRTVVRSAATDRGHGRFSGEIAIASGTMGSRASLRDDALILSREAYLDARPVLEIGSNAASADLAATVGSLDEEALFYVQSRGIPRGTAERMMSLAFFEAAIAGFPGEAVRDEVRTALDAALDAIPETFIT